MLPTFRSCRMKITWIFFKPSHKAELMKNNVSILTFLHKLQQSTSEKFTGVLIFESYDKDVMQETI